MILTRRSVCNFQRERRRIAEILAAAAVLLVLLVLYYSLDNATQGAKRIQTLKIHALAREPTVDSGIESTLTSPARLFNRSTPFIQSSPLISQRRNAHKSRKRNPNADWQLPWPSNHRKPLPDSSYHHILQGQGRLERVGCFSQPIVFSAETADSLHQAG